MAPSGRTPLRGDPWVATRGRLALEPGKTQVAINVAGALALLAFLLLLSPGFINSDSASGVLLAGDLVRAGRWLSPDWAYVSDSLTIDGRVQLAMAASLLWGTSVVTFVATACMGAVFAFAASYCLSRQLGASPRDAVTAALVLLLGPSFIYMDLVLGLTISIQMAWVLWFVVAIAGYVHARRTPLLLLVAFGIVLLLAVSSPKKAVAYVALPYLAATFAVLAAGWLERDAVRAVRGRLLAGAAAVCIACAAGHVVHQYLLHGLTLYAGYARMHVALSPDRVVDNLRLCWRLLLRFAGDGNSLLQAGSVVLALSASIILMVAPWIRTRRVEWIAGPAGFACLFALLGLAGIGAYLLTYEDIKVWYGIYYALMPACPLLSVCAAVAGERAVGNAAFASRAGLILVLLLGVCNVAFLAWQPPRGYLGIGKNQTRTHLQRSVLVDWLLANDLERGYALYWDANAMTLLSNGKLQVGAVGRTRTGNKLRRFAWLTSKARVNYQPTDGEAWFIALPTRGKGPELPVACLPAERRLQIQRYDVHVYRRAMPGCLPPGVRFGPRGRHRTVAHR